MKQPTVNTLPRTIGFDLGSKSSVYCILDETGEISREGSVAMSRKRIRQFFADEPQSRVILEASGSSRWTAQIAMERGHEVVIGNPRKISFITVAVRPDHSEVWPSPSHPRPSQSKVVGMNNTDSASPLRNPTASELPALLTDLAESGLGIAAFARSRGLKPQNLYMARRRRMGERSSAPVFDSVRITGLGSKPSSFELELSSGRKLLVPADFESSALVRLLEVLGAC